MEIKISKNILDANDQIAERNTQWFKDRGVFVINLMASPGAGKTSFITRTIEVLRDRFKIAVIEGDIASKVDAEKISQMGIPAVQINTGGLCHLDANMIEKALGALTGKDIDLLIVENVGNLVCPAEFRIGETARVMILSVAEGHDKPLKYPLIFSEADVLIVNKTDMLELTDFDMVELRNVTLGMNPDLEIFEVSCKTGTGLEGWYEWVENHMHER